MQQKIITLITSLFLTGCLPFDPMGSITLNLTDFEELTETRGEAITRGNETEGYSTNSENPTSSSNPTTEVMGSTSTPTKKWDLGDSPTSSITMSIPQDCGNGIVEGDEQCDGLAFKEGLTCESLGWEAGGLISCNLEDCTANQTYCSNVECPNYILDEGEECEPYLYGFQDGSSCTKFENDVFGKCIVIFYKPVYYSGSMIANGQMQTPELDQEEADIFCKIFYRNLDATAISLGEVQGWDNSRDYFSDSDLGLGPEKATLLTSASVLLGDFDLYYIPREYTLGLDPNHLQFRFDCIL